MSIFSQVRQRIHEKGVIGAARIVLAHVRDLGFDLKYGTDTLSWHQLDDLEVVGDNKDHGVYYQPTQARTLWKVLKMSALPTEGAFLDLGCGKGRALILAAEYGYGRVVGVEFSDLLCRIAESNLSRYARRSSARAAYEVVHADAAGYPIPDDVSTVFMFNPFDAVIMTKVVQNITASLTRRPRRLHIIYRHPLHREILDGSGLFRETVRYSFPQCDFLVYSARDRP